MVDDGLRFAMHAISTNVSFGYLDVGICLDGRRFFEAFLGIDRL